MRFAFELAVIILLSGCVPPGPKITADGIADIRLEKPVRPATYHTEFYADAQPLEGFVFDKPPVFAVISGGPFEAWGNQHPGQAAPAEIRQEAFRLASAGRLPVSMLVVTNATLSTDRGIAVGAGYARLKAVYANAELTLLPPLWEDPTCVAREGNLWFFFNGCQVVHNQPVLGSQARVIRIVVRR